MLPDFPKIKKRCNSLIIQHMQRIIMSDGLLSQIKTFKEFEGDSMSIRTEDTRRERRSSYDKIESELSIPKDELIEKGLAAYFERIEPLARDLQKKQTLMVFKTLAAITKETGNVVAGGGKPPTGDLFLSLLEKIWIEFDDAGKPRLPTMIVSPEMGEKIKGLIPIWNADESYKKRHEAIIEKKRKEWNDRESHRKLVG